MSTKHIGKLPNTKGGAGADKTYSGGPGVTNRSGGPGIKGPTNSDAGTGDKSGGKK